MSEDMRDMELAWENGIDTNPPQELWRVTSWRKFRERRLRHTNWFANEDAACNYAQRITDKGDEVTSVVKYVQEEAGGEA